MGKHSLNKDENTETKNSNFWVRVVSSQGEKIIELENKLNNMENRLIQERADRIEELREIRFLATCNSYGNEKIFLNKIAEKTGEKLESITDGIIKAKKELSSNTNQSIKN